MFPVEWLAHERTLYRRYRDRQQRLHALALRRGINLTLLTRGKHAADWVDGAEMVRADINDPASVTQALRGRKFDVVVNWIAFVPADIERDIELFRGRTRQYIFISSASAYQKPATDYLITESTPLANPHWDYSETRLPAKSVCSRPIARKNFRSRLSVRRSHTAKT